MTNQELIESLMSDYFEVESEMAMLKVNQEHIRAQIEKAVKNAGGTISTLTGSASMIAGSKSYKYDSDKLDTLMAESLAAGDKHTAKALADARKESVRKASLRIVKYK